MEAKAKSVCESERRLTVKSGGSWLDLAEKTGRKWRQELELSPVSASSDKEGVTTKRQHFPNSFATLFLRAVALPSLHHHSDI